MKIRSLAMFKSNFPDDHIETEDEIVQPSGKAMIEEAAKIFVALGCSVEEPYFDFRGWFIYLKYKRSSCHFQVVDIDETERIISLTNHPLENFFWKKDPEYVELIDRFAVAFGKNPHFWDVLWYPWNQPFGVPGDPHPINRDPPRRSLFAWLTPPPSSGSSSTDRR